MRRTEQAPSSPTFCRIPLQLGMGRNCIVLVVSSLRLRRLFSSWLCAKLKFPVHHFLSCLELELIQTQMTQKPMLRAEVYARALRASQNLV